MSVLTPCSFCSLWSAFMLWAVIIQGSDGAIVVKPENAAYYVGYSNPLTARCASNQPPPTAITWTFDANPITTGQCEATNVPPTPGLLGFMWNTTTAMTAVPQYFCYLNHYPVIPENVGRYSCFDGMPTGSILYYESRIITMTTLGPNNLLCYWDTPVAECSNVTIWCQLTHRSKIVERARDAYNITAKLTFDPNPYITTRIDVYDVPTDEGGILGANFTVYNISRPGFSINCMIYFYFNLFSTLPPGSANTEFAMNDVNFPCEPNTIDVWYCPVLVTVTKIDQGEFCPLLQCNVTGGNPLSAIMVEFTVNGMLYSGTADTNLPTPTTIDGMNYYICKTRGASTTLWNCPTTGVVNITESCRQRQHVYIPPDTCINSPLYCIVPIVSATFLLLAMLAIMLYGSHVYAVKARKQRESKKTTRVVTQVVEDDPNMVGQKAKKKKVPTATLR